MFWSNMHKYTKKSKYLNTTIKQISNFLLNFVLKI